MLTIIFASLLALAAQSSAQGCDALTKDCSPSVILVAAATANTGGHAVRELSAAGSVDIRAMVRKLDDPRVQALKELPRVTLIQGDFDDEDSIVAALEGVDRAMLVSAPFDYKHFEREVFFIQAAGDKNIPVVRVGTATKLMGAGTITAYARAHVGVEAYADHHSIPMVTLRPNWFMDNFLFAAAEAKGAGTISYPASGDKPIAMIDPRDVASAAATILLLPGDQLQPFLHAKAIELHGDKFFSWKDQLAALSKAVGYEIKFNQVPTAGFVGALVGFGMPRVFAKSFAHTIEDVGGVTPSHMLWGPDPETTSPLLTALGWAPKQSLETWVSNPKVLAAFKKDDTA